MLPVRLSIQGSYHLLQDYKMVSHLPHMINIFLYNLQL